MQKFRRDLGQLWEGLYAHHRRPQSSSTGMDASSSTATAATVDDADAPDRRQAMMMEEAGRALRAWMVFYGIFFLLLLAYKWQTKGYYQAEYERKLNATISSRPWWVIQEAKIEEAKTGIRDLGKTYDAELKVTTQQETRLESMKQVLEQLDTDFLSVRATAQLSGSLDSLLQRATLAEIPSSTVLNHLFVQAIADLKQVLVSAETLDWASVQSQLSVEFPPKQPSVAQEGVVLECPTAADEDMGGPSIPPETARKSDLDEHLATIDVLLKKRTIISVDQGLSAIVAPHMISTLEQTVRQRIESALKDIVKAATAGRKEHSRSSRSPGSRCLDREGVVEIVEEGLLALQQHANLRNVLRKKAIELNPSITSIILDADLPPPTPKIPFRETTNLGRVLDTPLVLQLARGIDHLIEMAGGYNDQLDQWLDSVVGGRESVGEMVVRKLLEESGKIEIPSLQKVAEQYLPQEAQQFFKKSKVRS